MILSWFSLIVVVVSPALGQVYYKLFFQTHNRWHLVAALFFFGLAPLCGYIALKQISVGVVNMSTAVTQLIVVALAQYWLKERLTRNHWIAMILIFTGVIIYTL